MRPEDITTHHDTDPQQDPWVHGPPPAEPVEVVAHDSEWPLTYRRVASDLRRLLGDQVLDLDHVGSTAVPGLDAKPVIDVVLTVADAADEASYVPALAATGWDLTVREPWFHEHRCLRLDRPRVNLHVFGPDSPETIRMVMFRDWLIQHPDDLALYAATKRSAAGRTEPVMDYNARKEPVVRAIYDRAFRAVGLA